jgi:MerR family transcriptional regulator, copper efflux regulator
MLQIGQLAQATGLTREALRFYEKSGLIRAQRQPNGYRVYPQEAADIVGYIRLAQQLGFSLNEIGSKLPQVWNAPDSTSAINTFLADKVVDIDERITQLQNLRVGLLARMGSECPMQNSQASP